MAKKKKAVSQQDKEKRLEKIQELAKFNKFKKGK